MFSSVIQHYLLFSIKEQVNAYKFIPCPSVLQFAYWKFSINSLINLLDLVESLLSSVPIKNEP